MKTRQGFVSNSSSSSFIIGFKKQGEEKCSTCGRAFLTSEKLKSLCENSDDFDTELSCEGKQEILDYIKQWWSFEESEIQDIENKLDKVNSPIMVDVGYRNELLQHIIQEDKNIEIIYEER